jgi:hypothetical protein
LVILQGWQHASQYLEPQILLIAQAIDAALDDADAIILLILWLLGLVSSYTMGGLIHLFLVIAIVMIAINVIQGRRV